MAAIQDITRELVFSLLPPRAPESHKGNYGKVLAVCGCAEYRGAAVLACLGALRAGAGLVTLAAPECVCAAAAPRMLEATYLCAQSREELLAAAGQYAVCLAGCGRTADEATAEEMRALLAAAKGTFVLDAGGLSAIGTAVEALAPCAGRLVVTPHPGEMARLAGISVAQVLQMPADVALGFARKTGAVTVLKGHRTLVATPDGRLYRNTTGNAGLARGGSGDILAGMVAGLAAQRLSPEAAAVCGVWLHGAAADVCAARHSMQGMLPEDILQGLCAVFLENGR